MRYWTTTPDPLKVIMLSYLKKTTCYATFNMYLLFQAEKVNLKQILDSIYFVYLQKSWQCTAMPIHIKYIHNGLEKDCGKREYYMFA